LQGLTWALALRARPDALPAAALLELAWLCDSGRAASISSSGLHEKTREQATMNATIDLPVLLFHFASLIDEVLAARPHYYFCAA
jgi:hypothetical protein